MSNTFTASVEGSGQTLKLEFFDASGNPTNLGAIGSTNDVQTLAITGALTANQFPLTFNGQTTTEISATLQIPARYALFTLPVTPGTSYTVACDVGYGGGGGYPDFRVDLIDGISGSTLGAILATQTLDQSAGTYDNLVKFDGTTPSYMKTIGTVTPSTSLLLVLYSTATLVTGSGINDNGGISVCSLINNSTSAVTPYGVTSSQFSFIANNCGIVGTGTGPYGYYSGNLFVIHPAYGAPAGTPPLPVGGPTATVSASSIQSALVALSSVGTGNLTVTDQSGAGVGPYTIAFEGALADADQPLITSTSSGITITHTRVGGQYPSYTINSGSAVSYARPIYWGSGNLGSIGAINTVTSPYIPAAWLFLPQSPPAVSYFPYGSWPYDTSDYNWYFYGGLGYTGAVTASNTPGSSTTVYLDLEGVQDGTYQISMTWPTTIPGLGGSLGTSVGVSITDSQGNHLGSYTINQSVAPSGVTDAGFTWSILGSFTIAYPVTGFNITVTAGSSGFAVVDAFRIARTSAIIATTIAPTDVVTVTVPDGLFTTAAGPIPAQTVTATNYSGGTSLTPVSGTAKTLPVGYNVEPDNDIQPALTYSNLAGRLDFSGTGTTLDRLGNPVSSTAGVISVGALLTLPSLPYSSLGGLAVAPSGLWTVEWDGASNVTLTSDGITTVTEQTGYQTVTGSTNNRRVYNMQPFAGAASAPTMLFQAHASGAVSGGVYPYSLSNIRIYPPDPADSTGMTPWLSGQPYWYPTFLRFLSGAKTLRFLDWLGINGNSIGDYADFRVAGSLAAPTRQVVGTIASITNPASPYFYPGRTASLEITFTAPINIPNPCEPTLTITETITFSDGQTMTPGTYIGVQATVISSTVIHLAIPDITPGATMTGTTSGGTVTLAVAEGTGIFTDIFSLCNTVGVANCWLNVPLSATDACVTSMAEAALALNSGINVCVEYSNETWNYGFYGTSWLDEVAYHLTGTFGYAHPLAYVHRAQQVHNIFLSVWTAAGRGSNVKRVLGSQAVNPAVTSAIISACNTYGATFEYLANAIYVNGFQGSPGNAPDVSLTQVCDQLTQGQDSDFFDRIVEYDRFYSDWVTAHQTLLTAAGFTGVQQVAYEAGPQFLSPNASTVAANKRSYQILFAPRFYAAIGRFIQKLQDVNLALLNFFYLFGNGYNTLGTRRTTVAACWAAYIGYNQADGTGVATTDTVNAATPTALNLVKSEFGGRVKAWNALVPSSSASSPYHPGRQLPSSRPRSRSLGRFTRGR